MTTHIVIGVVLGAVVLFAIYLFREGGKIQAVMKKAAVEAQPRDATVLSWQEHSTTGSDGIHRYGAGVRDVRVRVHVADADDYIACNTWNLTRGRDLVEGATIAVRVHATRPDIVFPDVRWLEYQVDHYAMKLYHHEPAVDDDESSSIQPAGTDPAR